MGNTEGSKAYKYVKPLGVGGNATAYLMMRKSDKKQFAMKKISAPMDI